MTLRLENSSSLIPDDTPRGVKLRRFTRFEEQAKRNPPPCCSTSRVKRKSLTCQRMKHEASVSICLVPMVRIRFQGDHFFQNGDGEKFAGWVVTQPPRNENEGAVNPFR